MRRFISVLALAGLATLPSALMADLRLLMAEEDGCMWCARWDAELSEIYPKTAEGQAAPLTRIDIHDPLPPGIALERALRFTPTFVLLHDGAEVGRIEGYPGEDFFWGLLDTLISDARTQADSSGSRRAEPID